jgi:lipopolysaccharide transport system permease protein
MNKKALVIEADKADRDYFVDLYRFRELFGFLAWRDILVRYKQAVFGILWAVLPPFLTMLVFVVVFGKLAKMSSGSVPYPIMVYTAMLPWQLFASAFANIANSLVSNSNLLSKVYFPRLIVPVSAAIVAFVDFLIASVILAGMMVFYRFVPSWHAVFLPFFVLMLFMTVLGVGLYIAALNVKYRDFRYVVPFIVQFGIYVSPVGFSSSVVPEKWYVLYALNPMVGIIDGFRWAVLGVPCSPLTIGYAFVVSAAVLVFGFAYFRKTERNFADIV